MNLRFFPFLVAACFSIAYLTLPPGTGRAEEQTSAPKVFGQEPARQLDEKGILRSSGAAIEKLVRQALPVEGGLLDESWEAVAADKRQIHRQGKGYYIVAVNKSDEDDGTLYLLLSDKGELYDANYNGSFEGLKE